MQHGTNLHEASKLSETVLKHKLKMKTTEKISLSGYAFTIETDAYAELGTYLNDIKAAFRNDSNADEIVSDIEERIAEILREKCANGMVVDMNMINDIKQRIGNPRDLAQDDSGPVTEEANTETPDPKRSWKTKRLYRDVENKVFGGVCSGLGAYFGFDKVLLRIALILIFVILFIGSFDESEPFFFIPVIAYLGLWIAMPAARTDEQKRELTGRPVNLDGYKENGFDFKKEVKEASESPAVKAITRAGGIFLGLMLMIMGFGGMAGSIFIPSTSTIVSHEIADSIDEWGINSAEEQFVSDLLMNNETFWIMLVVIVGIMSLWFIYNGVTLTFNLKYPSWKPGLVIFISWVISIFVFAVYVGKIAIDAFGTFVIFL